MLKTTQLWNPDDADDCDHEFWETDKKCYEGGDMTSVPLPMVKCERCGELRKVKGMTAAVGARRH